MKFPGGVTDNLSNHSMENITHLQATQCSQQHHFEAAKHVVGRNNYCSEKLEMFGSVRLKLVCFSTNRLQSSTNLFCLLAVGKNEPRPLAIVCLTGVELHAWDASMSC
jgi:hypothetical protein